MNLSLAHALSYLARSLAAPNTGASTMAMNRIQFQHGMSLPDFIRNFGTEEQCNLRSNWRVGPVDFAARAATLRLTTLLDMAHAACSSAMAAGIKPP